MTKRSRSRNRIMRAAIFIAIVFGALALVMTLRRPRVPRVASRIPTGGAAAVTNGGGDAGEGSAIVEDARRYPVRVWSFGLDRYDVRVEDAAMTTALDRILKETHSDFVVNGGFFDPSGNPVGLVMSDGVVLSKLGRNLSGGVLTLTETADGPHADLFAAETFAIPDGGRFAIQCRPRLVVDRAPNVKSDDGKRAERTALCTRDGGRTIDVIIVRGSDDGESAGPSLFALAKHLSESGCESALNLDGGPSTGAAWKEGDTVKLLAPRNAVRHVVAFRERH